MNDFFYTKLNFIPNVLFLCIFMYFYVFYVFMYFFMYFESVFIKPNNFYINIHNIKLSEKLMKIAFFVASKVGRRLNTLR